MAVLEICQLKIKPHFSPADPPLLHALQKARTELASRVYNTHSRFYQAMDDPSLIYIFGVWPSVARHDAFLASAERGEILDSQEEFFDFGWLLHVEIGDRGMDDLPLKVPVLCLARYGVRGRDGEGGKLVWEEAWGKYNSLMVEASKPFPVCSGWRVDGKEGESEFLALSGWDDELAHGFFTQDAKGELERLRKLSESEEVRQMLDMEGVM